MQKSQFLEELEGVLEMEDLEYHSIIADDLDSMAIMGLVAIIDRFFEKKISGEKLQSVNTVLDLVELIGRENIEE